MPTPIDTPTFNLKVAVQETGLKPDTLRAWERRYGIPQPERTAGGHRLYSRKDIDTLKWLVARQQEGMSISRAVDLWRKLEAQGQNPLQAATSKTSALVGTIPGAPTEGTELELRQSWVAVCLAFDEAEADRILSHAFALFPVETVCLEVLQKGLSQIGQGWSEGQITVQQEHFASALALRRIEALLIASPAPTRPGHIVLGCPPEEEHTFSLLLLDLFLRRRGWDTIYLGANVPGDRLEATLSKVEPSLVILAAQHLRTAAALLDLSRIVQAAQTRLAFGGLIFNQLPTLRSRIPGYFLGEQLDEATRQAEQLLTSPQSLPPLASTQPISEVFRQALDHYREREAMIETRIGQITSRHNLRPTQLAEANRYLARYIEAALALEDLSFLSQDVFWTQELLSTYELTSEQLPRYLGAYYQAAKAHLDESGQVIVNWLAQFDGLDMEETSPSLPDWLLQVVSPPSA